ncbi:MAG: hypothetical protein ABS43_03675 [Bordetella sp. SCN 67-23]|nr:helix-turn-helix transcriptional regulator [Burkholderiales bacterium]ODS75901.1 MAG: hypothetical protein ABS43_03675 [Bordetella sp. SCN 67-23]OJW91777.1 MAG: hypothetical protein BGO71_21705 [Burkholderiales bacterium 67-32]
MNPYDIQAAIKKAGHSQASIARKLRVSRTAVTYVVRGDSNSKSKRIAKTIAAITGKSLNELWPGLYV